MLKVYIVHMVYKNNPTFSYKVEEKTKSAAVRRAIRFYAAIIKDNTKGKTGKKIHIKQITPHIVVTGVEER